MTKQEVIERIATIEKLIADAKVVMHDRNSSWIAFREAAGTERFYAPELKSLKHRLEVMERA